jgi:Skp family chaperone for outer membrane proteins
MNASNKFQSTNAGWVVAGVFALGFAFMVGSGFQGPAQKIGTVNMGKVFNDSDYVKRQDSLLKSAGAARTAVLQFINSYKMHPNAELLKFRDLSIKDNQSEADRAEIERIRNAAIASDTKYRGLQTKSNLTDAEKQQLTAYQKNVQDNEQFLPTAQEGFGTELQGRQEKLRVDTLEKVKAAVADTAQKQGFSIILTDEVAPYSANDLTAEALKAMNAKNK